MQEYYLHNIVGLWSEGHTNGGIKVILLLTEIK